MSEREREKVAEREREEGGMVKARRTMSRRRTSEGEDIGIGRK